MNLFYLIIVLFRIHTPMKINIKTDDVKKLVVDDHAVPQLVCSVPQLVKKVRMVVMTMLSKLIICIQKKITLDLSVVCISQFF